MPASSDPPGSSEPTVPVYYRTKAGDRLDAICWRHYGRSERTVAAVLDANPGLAEHGPVLRAGLIVLLPVMPPPPRRTVRLWD